jgi:hypothetical protein
LRERSRYEDEPESPVDKEIPRQMDRLGRELERGWELVVVLEKRLGPYMAAGPEDPPKEGSDPMSTGHGADLDSFRARATQIASTLQSMLERLEV